MAFGVSERPGAVRRQKEDGEIHPCAFLRRKILAGYDKLTTVEGEKNALL